MSLTGTQTQNVPLITWDQNSRQFCVTVVGVKFEKSDDENQESKIHYKPDCLYRTRVKNVVEDSWTPAFVSPLPDIGVYMWEPDTEYIVELCKLSTDDGSVLPDSTQELKVRDGIVVERVT